MKPSKLDVLRAVSTACNPQSVYINDEIQKWHRRNVSKGISRGKPPESRFVLKRLRECVTEGWLTQSRFTGGMVGYEWTITDAGRAELERRK